MKRLLALLSLTLGMTALAGNPYVGQNITRTYYEGDLESCPGLLDMQPGDLWTLTFPDNITDSFLTRDGLVERKVQDNRVVMAVTATSGTSPMLVMTEDGHAPRFMITIQGGAGGRNKNVVIKPGWSGTSACGGVRSVTPAATPTAATPVQVDSMAPKAAVASTKPPPPVVKLSPTPSSSVKSNPAKSSALKPPTTSPVSAPPTAGPPQAPVTVAVPGPTTPASTAAKSPPISTSSAAPPQAPALVAVPTPAAPTPTVTLVPTTATPASAVIATGPSYLTATVTPQAQGQVLSIQITSRLDADVLLDEHNLTFGEARSTTQRQVMVSAGEHVTLAVQLHGPLPKHQGRLFWTGSVLGSGETFLLSAVLAIPT